MQNAHRPSYRQLEEVIVSGASPLRRQQTLPPPGSGSGGVVRSEALQEYIYGVELERGESVSFPSTNSEPHRHQQQQQQPQPQHHHHQQQQHHHQRPLPNPHARITRIFLAFCTASQSRQTGFRYWLKRAIRSVAGRIGHVEPVFVFEDGRTIACTMLYGQRVRFEHRDPSIAYLREYWETYSIDLNEHERAVFWNYCVAQNEKPYNTRGLWCNFLPMLRCLFGTSEEDESSWICSQLIVASLKRAREHEFGRYVSSRTTPVQLYDMMQAHRCFAPIITVMDRRQLEGLRLQ